MHSHAVCLQMLLVVYLYPNKDIERCPTLAFMELGSVSIEMRHIE